MILPILDYCCVVFHGSGKGNEEELECLQRRGGRIVLNVTHLSTEGMTAKLGWDFLRSEEKTTLSSSSKSVLMEKP